jgi:hypothetical protein
MAEAEIFVVHEFSVRPADQPEVDQSIAAIVAHIRDDHPEVVSCQTYRQWIGPRPHRGYSFMEGYTSLAALESAPGSPTCTEVWEPIYRLAQEATVMRCVWLATAPELTLTR